MSLYNPEGTPPIVSTGVARVERMLPHPGEVLTRTGGRVEPEDIVAKAFVPAAPKVINVAQELAIPTARIKRVLRRKVGSNVQQGEVLGRVGLRTSVSPVRGILSAIDTETGYVAINPDPVAYELPAALRGIAMEVVPHRGVVIETPATQVYGVFGLGGERSGVLRLLLVDSNEVITPDYIDARSTYSILVCSGAGITAPALRRAVQEQVRGIILGSADERELRAFLGWARWSQLPREARVRTMVEHQLQEKDIYSFIKLADYQTWYTGIGGWEFPSRTQAFDPGISLLVTEGFGRQAMAVPIFDVLSSKDRQEALIEGGTCLRQKMRRPRLVIPLARSTGEIEPPRPQVQPGRQVRLLDHEHLGQTATVRNVTTIPQRLPSGIQSIAVEVVQEEDSSTFWLPRTAVEVLE